MRRLYCKRFEAARSEGRFPILSALLTETSEEDLEEFFRSGWAHMALPPRESSVQRPWDSSPWDGDLEAYREDLYAGMAFGMPDMRPFAREWLEELLRVGYYGMEESLGLPFKQRSGDYFAPPKPLPIYGNAYPTRIAQTGQTVWIRLDGPRSPEHGYREISVSDEPLRTDAAIVAALSALEGRTFDLGTLRSVLAVSMPLRGESFWDVPEHPGQHRKAELRTTQPYEATQKSDRDAVEERGYRRATDIVWLGRHQGILRYAPACVEGRCTGVKGAALDRAR